MIELIIIGILAWAFYRYTAVSIVIRLLLFIFSVTVLILLFKIGFISVYLEALISIPVMFFQGLFLLVQQLLV